MEQFHLKNKDHASKFTATLTPLADGAGLVAKLCSTRQPQGLEPTWLLCPRDFPGKNTGVGCHSLLHPGIEPEFPALVGRFLTTEPPGKPHTFG